MMPNLGTLRSGFVVTAFLAFPWMIQLSSSSCIVFMREDSETQSRGVLELFHSYFNNYANLTVSESLSLICDCERQGAIVIPFVIFYY